MVSSFLPAMAISSLFCWSDSCNLLHKRIEDNAHNDHSEVSEVVLNFYKNSSILPEHGPLLA